MQAWKRFQDWSNVVLGAWLFLSPFVGLALWAVPATRQAQAHAEA